MKHIDILKKFHKWLEEVPFNSNHHELKYSIERVEDFTKALFGYAKFKVGDIVQLKETPVINEKEAWGWWGYRDILVKGAKAKVEEVDHYKGIFRYSLTILHPKEKGLFTFSEDKLELAGD